MKKLGLIFFAILCLLIFIAGYFYIKSTHKRASPLQKEHLETDQKDYQNALTFLESKDYKNAGRLIKKHLPLIESQKDPNNRWLNLFIRLNTETANIRQLEAIYQFDPNALLTHEQASLLLAESWLNRGRTQELEQLRQSWIGREKKQETWQLLDAESLILEGKRDQAIAKLESQHFEGNKDSPRLIQLALLYLSQDPKKAWGYLEIANNKDPDNPSILTYRGKFLESIGQHEWALKEYAAAAAADHGNLAHNDQLVEFHLRNEQLEEAMQTLQASLNHPALTEEIAVKAFFWNRMVRPFEVEWKSILSSDQNFPLYNYLVKLPPANFWNEPGFNRLANSQKYSERLQAIWWLRLLSALQHSDTKAEEMIDHNPFSHLSWNPALELAFKRILNYRLHGTLYLKGEHLNPVEPETKENSESQEFPDFFLELNRLAAEEQQHPNFKMTEEMNLLLHSNEAFVAALMAAGWNEAAIEMHNSKAVTPGIPQWVNRQYGMILQANRGLSGVEQRARQAHYVDDFSFAQTLYHLILEESTEAKSYLARQAFVDKQWKVARELTIQLLKEHPGNQQLWENLSKIESMLNKEKQQ